MPATSAKTRDVEVQLADTYRIHYGFVWRSLRRLGVPEHAVDDAVHDVFVVAARRLHEFEGRAALTSWLFAVAVRIAAHHRRAIARHERRRSALAQTVQSSGPPKDAFARRDAAQTLHDLLEALDDEHRHVFILMELEQMTGREVADMLGLKVATVHSRLRSARDQLRRAAARAADDEMRRSA
jgi:RNA polymerase sigma-70 factor (ECF subfamily)